MDIVLDAIPLRDIINVVKIDMPGSQVCLCFMHQCSCCDCADLTYTGIKRLVAPA